MKEFKIQCFLRNDLHQRNTVIVVILAKEM